MSPCSVMTVNSYFALSDSAYFTLMWMSVAEYGTAMIGLVVVFGFYRKQTKPTIVKVIWGVTTLGILNGVTRLILFGRFGQSGLQLLF